MSNEKPTVDDLGTALAVETVKCHRLTELQVITENKLDSAVMIIRHGIARNKELIHQLGELQARVIPHNSASDTFDAIGKLLAEHDTWAQNFATELECATGICPRDLDKPLDKMLFLKPKE